MHPSIGVMICEFYRRIDMANVNEPRNVEWYKKEIATRLERWRAGASGEFAKDLVEMLFDGVALVAFGQAKEVAVDGTDAERLARIEKRLLDLETVEPEPSAPDIDFDDLDDDVPPVLRAPAPGEAAAIVAPDVGALRRYQACAERLWALVLINLDEMQVDAIDAKTWLDRLEAICVHKLVIPNPEPWKKEPKRGLVVRKLGKLELEHGDGYGLVISPDTGKGYYEGEIGVVVPKEVHDSATISGLGEDFELLYGDGNPSRLEAVNRA